MAELSLTFDSFEKLSREYEANLHHGRAFVAGQHGLALFAPCTLRLARTDTGAVLDLDARVVMVSDREPMRGTAVELLPGPWRQQLEAFVQPPADSPGDVAPAPQGEPEPEVEAQAEAGTDLEPEPNPEGEPDLKTDPKTQDRRAQLRNLSPTERARVAHSHRLEDRVLLERMYGSAVWDLLLHSPHVTIPEVSRMARKATLPRPLLDLIIDNPQWIRYDIVRRALLTNPRVSPDGTLKILRATPPRDLKLIAAQTSYPAPLRALARKLMGER